MCRLKEMTFVNCLAKSVFILPPLSLVEDGLRVWGVSYEQFVKSSVRSLRMSKVGITFTFFPMKSIWSLSIHSSIRLSFTLFIHICMHSFMCSFTQPILIEYVAVYKTLSMQIWNRWFCLEFVKSCVNAKIASCWLKYSRVLVLKYKNTITLKT